MSSLTDALPQLTVVKVGGVDYIIGQLQVKDIAVLQDHLERQNPHPYEVHRDAILEAEGERREALILRVQKGVQDWPPSFCPDSIEDDWSLLNAFLWVVLSRHNDLEVRPTYFPTRTRGLTAPEAVARLSLDITRDELDAIKRVAFDDTPQERFSRLMKSNLPDNGSAKYEDTWAENIDWVATTHNLTYEQVGEMTLSQFGVAGTGGKPEKKSNRLAGMSHEEQIEQLKRERRLLKMEV